MVTWITVLVTQGTWLFSFHTLRLRNHTLGQVSMSCLPCLSSYRGDMGDPPKSGGWKDGCMEDVDE